MTLHTYLPQDRYRALARGESLPDRATGSALFADISGFTALAESLRNTLGARRGGEELNKYLGEIYGILIAELECYGGSVIAFAGDALLCWFDQTHAPSAARAVAAAFSIQNEMKAFSEIALPGSTVASLSVKIAIASGAARRFVVGDPEIQKIDTLAGATVARTSTAEHLASKGEIVVDEATAQALGDSLTIKEWREDEDTKERFAVISDFTGNVDAVETNKIESLSNDVLQSWAHRAVYERETTGSAFLTEFRPCVALFIRFTGIDYDSDSAESELDTFIRNVQATASRYEGTLMDITIGDKGSYAYVDFGALAAHEDDSRRAVKAALELRNKTELQLQMGITQGLMRVGAYGGETRKVFGALGDDVNLAARLMTTASVDEILLSSHVHKAVQEDFTFEPRSPLPMKGKAEPLPVFALTGESQIRAVRLLEPNYSLPMVGRVEELRLIEEKLDLAKEGKGQVIGIIAEAGLGKSRLVAEVIRAARKKGFVGYGGACQSDAVNTPYQAWKSIWQAFFDVDPVAPLRRQIRSLEGEIDDRAPERLDSLPLVGEMLGIDIPENEFTQALEPKDRRGALSALLEDCLKSAAVDEPLLFVLEDIHWIDALSHDLLEVLARATSSLPICFVLAYRPPQLPRLQLPRIEVLEQFTRIALSELTAAEAESAVRAKLTQLYPARGGALPAGLVETLMARAQGNPFFLEELLNYLRDRGIDPSEIEKIELPDSLHTLILSRIDQLSEGEKTTLRVASIVGRMFRAQWLTGYYPELGSFPQVKAALDVLSGLDITPLDSPEPELAYLFKHIVTHEVTYESLPFATRAELHEQLAQYLEVTYADDPPIDILAYHYGLSDNREKKREYLRKSAEAAYRSYANEAALEYYEQALALSPEPGEAVDIHLMSGTIIQMSGDWEKAREHFQRALSIAEKHKLTKKIIESQVKIGTLLVRKGDYPSALEWLNKTYDLAKKEKDDLDLCDVLVEMGTAHWRVGDFEAALSRAQESLDLARSLGEKKRQATALFLLATIHGERGEFALGHSYFEETYAIDNELNDSRHLGSTLLNWGTTYYYQGDYQTAKKYVEKSLDSYREIGERRGLATALNNLGNIYYLDGDFQTAKRHYNESFTLSQNIGDRQMMAISVTSLGITAFQEGNLDEADKCYQLGMQLSTLLDLKVNISLLHCYMGLLALARSQIDFARESFTTGLEIAHKSNIRTYVIYNLIGCAGVHLARGNSRAAATLLGAVDAISRSIGLKIEPELQQPFDRAEQAARLALGDRDFSAVWDAGGKMTQEEAVSFALNGLG